MKKKLVMMMLLTFMGVAAFAQNGKKLANSPELSKITALTDLAKQIEAAELSVATGTRATAAEGKAKVDALYVSYSKELANQKSIHAADKKFIAEVTEEENFVKTKTEIHTK